MNHPLEFDSGSFLLKKFPVPNRVSLTGTIKGELLTESLSGAFVDAEGVYEHLSRNEETSTSHYTVAKWRVTSQSKRFLGERQVSEISLDLTLVPRVERKHIHVVDDS